MTPRRLLAFAITFVAASAVLSSAAPAGAGGGGCHESVRTEKRATQVPIVGLCFKPTVVHVARGETVTWTNEDPVDHTVTGVNGSFGTYAPLAKGMTAKQRFDEPGTYPYFCVLHPGMAGAVVVGDSTMPVQQAAATAPEHGRRFSVRWMLVLLAELAVGLGLGYSLRRGLTRRTAGSLGEAG